MGTSSARKPAPRATPHHRPRNEQTWIGDAPTWYRVDKFSERAAELADGHYSRQTIGSNQVLPPGETLLLLTPDTESVWGVCHNMEPASDAKRWRVSIFHREGGLQASALIEEATSMTLDYWPRKYGWPAVPLTTEVDADLTKRKRDPGRCFRRAGWELWSTLRLFVFVAPGERARLGIQGPVMR
jgi:hypothetical protein